MAREDPKFFTQLSIEALKQNELYIQALNREVLSKKDETDGSHRSLKL
jgi:hypothetical protein